MAASSWHRYDRIAHTLQSSPSLRNGIECSSLSPQRTSVYQTKNSNERSSNSLSQMTSTSMSTLFPNDTVVLNVNEKHHWIVSWRKWPRMQISNRMYFEFSLELCKFKCKRITRVPMLVNVKAYRYANRILKPKHRPHRRRDANVEVQITSNSSSLRTTSDSDVRRRLTPTQHSSVCRAPLALNGTTADNSVHESVTSIVGRLRHTEPAKMGRYGYIILHHQYPYLKIHRWQRCFHRWWLWNCQLTWLVWQHERRKVQRSDHRSHSGLSIRS